MKKQQHFYVSVLRNFSLTSFAEMNSAKRNVKVFCLERDKPGKDGEKAVLNLAVTRITGMSRFPLGAFVTRGSIDHLVVVFLVIVLTRVRTFVFLRPPGKCNATENNKSSIVADCECKYLKLKCI